jgi:hypothetical protein
LASKFVRLYILAPEAQYNYPPYYANLSPSLSFYKYYYWDVTMPIKSQPIISSKNSTASWERSFPPSPLPYATVPKSPNIEAEPIPSHLRQRWRQRWWRRGVRVEIRSSLGARTMCSSGERDPAGRIWFLGFLLLLFWFFWLELERVEQATARRNNPSSVGLSSWRAWLRMGTL